MMIPLVFIMVVPIATPGGVELEVLELTRFLFFTSWLPVFLSVGNIPYDATEEQLKEICQEVGPVVSFRSVSRDSWKHQNPYSCTVCDAHCM